MTYNITLIPGDGIGPEVTEAAVRILDACEVSIQWERVKIGEQAMVEYGTPFPEEAFDSIRRNRVALKGPVTTPVGEDFSSPNVQLRRKLDLYVGLRPVRSLPGVKTPYTDVDIVVVRENTEGLYSGIEHVVTPGVVESLKVITRKASRRIARFAFDYAARHKRKQVTAVHKANIMKIADGLFLRCARQVAHHHPEIEYQEIIIDNLAMQLVLNHQQFDVLLLENFYGDVISDLCAGLVGGVGVVPGACIGKECALFEAVHGSAPTIAGKGVANPAAVVLSSAMMLEHLGEKEMADRLDWAVRRVIEKGETVTPDLGGKAGTQEMTEAIIREMGG
ncbi:MAG: isocitrate dehydrogenase (NAD(+)) [Candidatus Binatia bacterium]|nr:isocitrate dehydrogenase (NAD(+)) [Candidatus Binatia bacterium]